MTFEEILSFEITVFHSDYFCTRSNTRFKTAGVKMVNSRPIIAHVRVPWACFILAGSPDDEIHMYPPIMIKTTATNDANGKMNSITLSTISNNLPIVGGSSVSAKTFVTKRDRYKGDNKTLLFIFLFKQFIDYEFYYVW